MFWSEKMNLNKELKKGIFISAIGKYSHFIIQFSILAILSRILTPDEFGTVAIINVFLIFFSMLIDMGIGPAIIQNKNLKEDQINSIFCFSILLSLIFSLLFVFLSNPISLFYEKKELINVCITMSLALFTSGLNMVPQAIILKQKRFLELNLAQIFSGFTSGIVGIILAFNDFSYYSLIISSIFKNIIMFTILLKKSNLKITKKVNLTDLKLIYSFSRNQFLFNFLNYFSRNLDNLLIGKYLSLKDLAYYDKAYTLTLYPNQILTNVISPVVQPIMSEYESRIDIIKETYLKISKLLALLGLPLSVFLYFTSNEVIYFLFGSQWVKSVGIFEILSISIWIQLILSSTGAFFQASNRSDLLLLSGILSTILNVTSIIIGIWTGNVELLSVALVLSFLLNFVQANYLLLKKVFLSKQRYFYKLLINPLIIALMLFISLLCIDLLIVNISIYILLLIKIVVSMIILILGFKITGELPHIYKVFYKRK